MYQNTTGAFNTAVGQGAMQLNTTGNYNTAMGASAMFNNTTGAYNTAIGYYAGGFISTGTGNTLLGVNAGASGANNLTTGSTNIIIGTNGNASSSSVSNEVTIYNGTNLARFQGSATSWSFTSDSRDKTNVAGIPVGLDFIKTLRPVSYQWDRRDWYDNKQPDGSKTDPVISMGFIAQEVEEAVQASGNTDVLNRLVYKNDPENLMIAETGLIPILVKAVQELSAQVTALQAQVSALQASSASA